MPYFQSIGAKCSSGNVGHSGSEGSRFEPYHCKSGFFQGRGRHVHSFCFFQMILVRLASEEEASKSFGSFINFNEDA